MSFISVMVAAAVVKGQALLAVLAVQGFEDNKVDMDAHDLTYETALQTAQAHLKNIEKMVNTQRAQIKAKIEQPAVEVPPVVVVEQAPVKKAEPKVKKQQAKSSKAV